MKYVKKRWIKQSIEQGEEYSKIYKLSVELDELIAEYYNKKQKSNKR